MGRQCDFLAGFALRTPPIMSATLCARGEQATSEPEQDDRRELQSLRLSDRRIAISDQIARSARHTRVSCHKNADPTSAPRHGGWSRTRKQWDGVEVHSRQTRAGRQSQRMIATLHANEKKHPEVLVAPDGMNRQRPRTAWRPCKPPQTEISGTEDPLGRSFRQNFQEPVEIFLQQMKEQRQALDSDRARRFDPFIFPTFRNPTARYPTSLTVPRCSR